MHDTVWFEVQGLPSLTIASREFDDAADTQRRSLGLPDADYLLVDHPIQDATDDEMRLKARLVFPTLLNRLKGHSQA